MSKGNSGILSKHQSKLTYSSEGVIGDSKGYEVLKEVVIRIANNGVSPNHEVKVSGRMSNDTVWYDVGLLKGQGTGIFHIASWDYVLFECTEYDSGGISTLISSGYFNDGLFLSDSIEDMKNTLNNNLLEIEDALCKLQEQIYTLNRQIELITDHEEHEVK
jgi:hypothetical protein